MNIREMLLTEHTRKNCDRIVAFIGNNRKRFALLMKLFFEGEYRITQRAAWPMSYCTVKHPELIEPYLRPLIDGLARKGIHPAVARNSVRLLQMVEIPKKYHGKLMGACFGFLESQDTPVAIKVFSMTILDNLSRQYPEITTELNLIIEERWEHETIAFRTRALKILKKNSRKNQ